MWRCGVVAAALVVSVVVAAPTSFVHPGVVVSAADLAAARARLAAGTEPTKSYVAAAASLPQGRVDYKPVGPPSNGTISCGECLRWVLAHDVDYRDIDAYNRNASDQ